MLRKINSHLRAKDMLESSSAPIPLTRDPHARTSLKTKDQHLGFLQQNLTFKPRVNQSVPDFQTLYRNFQKLSVQNQSMREPTETKPFNLRTSSLSAKRRSRTDTAQVRAAYSLASSMAPIGFLHVQVPAEVTGTGTLLERPLIIRARGGNGASIQISHVPPVTYAAYAAHRPLADGSGIQRIHRFVLLFLQEPLQETPPHRSPDYLSSLSPNTLPVYITDSTKRREVAIR